MRFDLALNNALIMSPSKNWEPFIGSVGILNGRFTYVGETRITKDESREVLSLDNKVLMPGLVNGHIHGDMTLLRGLGDGLTLKEQNDAFAEHNWFYTYLSDEDRFVSRQLTYAEALLSGCTFILENMYWTLGDKSIDAIQSMGIRAALAEDFRPDFRDPKKTYSKEALKRFADLCRKEDIIPVLGSVSEEDFDPDVLNEVRALAKHADMLITCHLAETSWRKDLILERFGTTPVKYLMEEGFLGPDLIGSHVVHTSEEERLMLKESGTKVINTPLCEYKISDGLAAIPEMLELGITVGLGTDGAMWNNNIDLFREMKGILLANSLKHGPRSISPKAGLSMATISGAKAFGRDDLGDIKEGMLADFILLDFSKTKFRPVRMGQFENVSSSLVFNASGEDVSSVYVGGKLLAENQRLTLVDQEALIEEAESISSKWPF